MALPDLTLPYGARDLKIIPFTSGETLGTPIDLPALQTISWEEAEEFEELRGDDGVVAVRGKGAVMNWEISAGGLSLPAYAAVAGGTLTNTGTTPNQIRKLKKKGTDARPYFQVHGQAISDSGGDVHVVLFRCRANDTIEGNFEDGTFYTTGFSGVAIPLLSNQDLYEFTQNETATPIPES